MPVPPETAVSEHRVAPGEEHERRRDVVQHKESEDGADDVIHSLEGCLGRRRRAAGSNIGGREEERAHIAAAETPSGLCEPCESEGDVVPYCDTMLYAGKKGFVSVFMPHINGMRRDAERKKRVN